MQASLTHPAAKLADEYQAAGQLLSLLKREQACLINADVDGLTPLTEEKQKAISRMSELANERHVRLAAAGFAASEEGMQQWLASAAAKPADEKSWAALLALVQSAKEINRSNGILINTHMTRTQAALNVFQSTAQSANLYGPNGQATVKPVGRGLVVG